MKAKYLAFISVSLFSLNDSNAYTFIAKRKEVAARVVMRAEKSQN